MDIQNKISHWKKIRQINYLVISLVKPILSRTFFQKCVKVNFRNFHTREILSHWKKIRQINYLVISLVKPLLSRNFCEKSVRENFCNFHTDTIFPQCGNYRNSLSHFFRKNFVKAMILFKKLLNSWFDEKNFSEREFLVFPHCDHTMWELRKFTLTLWVLFGKFRESTIFKEILNKWFDEIVFRWE